VTSAQHVVVIRNPSGVLVLVHEQGQIVKATHPSYLGMSIGEARCAGISVMRWWNPEIRDNEYPEVIEVPA